MKKRIVFICFLIFSIFFAIPLLSSCAKYVQKYELEDCSVSEYEHNNYHNSVEYNKKYSGEDYSIYFGADLNNDKIKDNWIDRISSFSDLLKEKEYYDIHTFYVSNKLVANYWTDENGNECVSFPSQMAEEESLAWILQSQSSNDEIPYGIYAGVAAHWLNCTNYSNFIYSSADTASYLTELQFPIYEANNLSAKERNYAWSFSYNIVDEWIHSGKEEKEIMTLDEVQLQSFLSDKYSLTLPDYQFFPYSTQYEYKIKQNYFTYYINKEFNDLILPKEYFTTSYKYLADWLSDNDVTTKASNSLFNMDTMHPINVYLENGLNSNGISGEANNNYINIYSVGSFSHEYIHHILFENGQGGYLREVIPELHANTSRYSNLMWYYLLTGQAKNFPYFNGTTYDDKKLDEKKLYKEALSLYNKISIEAASPNNFNFWLFADCYAALNTRVGENFNNRLQPDSLQYYIANKYGDEYAWKLNLDNKLIIEGKTYSEVTYEWLDYLATLR